jgi:F0F1-type ATP synthase assembly protein I
MPKLRRRLEKKAVKATAKHSIEGVASKARRKPMRTSTLLVVGIVVGGLIGWVVGQRSNGAA